MMNPLNPPDAIGGRDSLASLIGLVADRAANPRIHKTKICFLLGAGADISAGGLSFIELKKLAVEEFSKRKLFDITPFHEIETAFEALFVSLEPDDRALLVESLFRRMQPLSPSDAYKLLVLLAEAGGVDAIVTTNFDMMLERAQEQLGRDVFQVFAPGLARPYLLSHERFELPKKPYLKLHGDIASRSVVLLTANELTSPSYDSSMLDLLISILQSHDLVLVGYSGFDPALAQIIVGAVETTSTRIFWCSPHPPSSQSPLYSKISGATRFVPIRFDDLMMEISKPVLEKPTLAPTAPTYIRCLLDWRVEYCNQEYINAYGYRFGKPRVEIFARRRAIEERLLSFSTSEQPLAIISGPSGFGKTTIGIRMHNILRSDKSVRLLLIRSRSLPATGDLDQYISEQLGGLGSRGSFSFFRFDRWLTENGLRLLLFVDGLNEFSPDVAHCVQLFRNILRFCYFLPEGSKAIRVIVTVRQETWNSMLLHIDMAQLRKMLWTDAESQQALNTIVCNAFTDDELQDAVARLRDTGYATIDTTGLAASTANQLRDPYMLGFIADAAYQGLPALPTADIYRRGFEAKLQQRGSFIDTATLKDILASMALKCLSTQNDRFREIDIHPAALREKVLRIMKDLHIFVDAGDGFLQFDHDRTLEFFLALGFATGRGPSLETIDDLKDFLRHFKTQSKAVAAARLYFQLAPEKRFPLLSTSLRLLDSHSSRYSTAECEMLFGFAREVLMEMTEQGEPTAAAYLADAVSAANTGMLGINQLRTVVQAAASLPIHVAIPLLARISHTGSSLAEAEANIYATDKLVKQYLFSGCPAIDLLQDPPYSGFFGDSSLSHWRRLGRLLGFAAQLGPDNTHAEEYASIVGILDAALDRLLEDRPWEKSTEVAIADFFLANCDRLLFNATPHGINRFFGNPARAEFARIVEKLADGQAIEEEDLRVFEPYTQSLSSDIEYHLSHILFILSSFNDLGATLALAENRFATFSNKTPPEEIDFFDAILVYLHVLHGFPYDPERFGAWEEKVLREWPDVLLYRPGLMRGERRGFHDLFDRVFEDGFGVIYPYGVLLPSLQRRKSSYSEYRRLLSEEKSSPLPLYTAYLEEFLRDERIEDAIQLLQALAGVIVMWPVEGLLTLKDVIGYPEPRIRRATIRILAEAFNRHPDETMQFLKTSGAAITDEDLLEIKIRQDPRIGRRQIDEEEWARMGHWLFRRPGAKQTFVECIRVLLRSSSFTVAIAEILQMLGLTEDAGR
jgi:SIR2-like domain